MLTTALRRALALLVVAGPALAQNSNRPADGAILDDQVYRVPFASVDAYIEFAAREDSTITPERKARIRRAYAPAFDRLLGDSVRISRIIYSSDTHRVVAYLVRPRPVAGVRHPAVIYNRGGNRDFGALEVYNLLSFTDLAAEGYVVIASQYRGVEGGDGQDEFGGADVHDVMNLLPILDSQADVDSTRIGMMGWSRGGTMTYLALSRTDRIAAAIVGSAASDLFDTIKHRPEMEKGVFAEVIPGYPAGRDSALRARSAVFWPERLNRRTPILLLHGTGDWRVDASQSLRMAERLYAVKHPFRLVVYEGGDHGLFEYRQEVNALVLQWLNMYVRDRKEWPSLEPHGL